MAGEMIKALQTLREAGRIEKEHASHRIFYAVETIADEKITGHDSKASSRRSLWARLDSASPYTGSCTKDDFFFSICIKTPKEDHPLSVCNIEDFSGE